MQEDGRIEPAAFVQTWKNLPEANETQKELPISITSLDSIKSRIEAANIFLMAHKQVKLCKFASLRWLTIAYWLLGAMLLSDIPDIWLC